MDIFLLVIGILGYLFLLGCTFRKPCPQCGGLGRVGDAPCDVCRGSGNVKGD